MNNSVTKVTCTNCKESFQGYLEELFDASKEYSATCPHCKKKTFFMGVGAFIFNGIPDGAVQIIDIENP